MAASLVARSLAAPADVLAEVAEISELRDANGTAEAAAVWIENLVERHLSTAPDEDDADDMTAEYVGRAVAHVVELARAIVQHAKSGAISPSRDTALACRVIYKVLENEPSAPASAVSVRGDVIGVAMAMESYVSTLNYLNG